MPKPPEPIEDFTRPLPAADAPDRRASGGGLAPGRAAGGPTDARGGFPFNRTAVPLTIAAVLALTAASVVAMLGWHRDADADRLAHLEDKLRGSIARRVMDHRHGLQSVRGLVLASESAAGQTPPALPTRPPLRVSEPVPVAFSEAVRSLRLGDAFPAARRVGKLGRLPSPTADAYPVLFAADATDEDFRLRPTPRPTGLRQIARSGEVETALGRATALGHGVFADAAEGTFLLLPVYRGGVTPPPSEREASSRGWVFMLLDRDALFAGLPGEVEHELDFRLAATGGQTLYDSRAGGGAPTRPLPRTTPLQIAGRQWSLEAGASEAFRARPVGDVWLAGLVGVVLAGLLAVLQHGQVRLAGRARALADGMTEDLRAAALTDRLTGLANRPALLHRVQESIERSEADPSYHHAVLFLDFDRFKIINDSLGHHSGDRLLRLIAERIRGQLRHEDLAAASSGRPGLRSVEHAGGAAARFGGDEFIVALEHLARPADAVAVAERLLKTLAKPYNLGGREVVSTASIGVVLGGGGHRWAEEMIRDADTAMYEAKDAGRAAWVLFDHAMRDRVAERLQTETDLRGAAARGEFELHYQPIMRLFADGRPPRIHRWEALIRWNHPERGRLFPDAFIGTAEETGLIVPLGEWVLCAALRQLAAWREAGLPGSDRWRVSVNLARQQLRGPGLAADVRSCLSRHGLPPEALHLEVTETEVMSDPRAAADALDAVRDLGVIVDMDDFGTGHSSLSCLDRFPLDVLKIDRSFVADLGDDPRRVAMLAAVARLAEDLDIDVVAEGIETPEHLAQVVRLRCSHGQGYHFSRPIPASEVPAWALAWDRDHPELRFTGARAA